ncbi:MAG TPA: beta galactosidase jelly roll domain-containing protein, partial [Candidatus Synoicihabitans sp.]|nr:beta galactosidase jelly roll domain-containing protein [Candidatus Synoicihabitans sp.]
MPTRRLLIVSSLLNLFPLLAGAQPTELVTAPVTASASTTLGRERVRLDEGWRFALGHASDYAQDFNHGTSYFSYLAKTGFGDGPASERFDDRAWREVRIPHDWAVELPFDPRGQASHGYKSIGRGFPATSVGWYRRTFTIPEQDLGRRISFEFDGVYRAARVFVNGFFVGEEPSGYLRARYDVSEYLNYGGENVIAVRVDATMPEGWYYEGAGIYRHVWLTKTAPLHVESDGVWVRSDVAPDGSAATLHLESTLSNAGREPAAYRLEFAVHGPTVNAPALANVRMDSATPLAPGARQTDRIAVVLPSPQLWDLDTPHLHTLVTSVYQGGQLVDRVETRFGIRTIRFDPNHGFFLNGRHVVL